MWLRRVAQANEGDQKGTMCPSDALVSRPNRVADKPNGAQGLGHHWVMCVATDWGQLEWDGEEPGCAVLRDSALCGAVVMAPHTVEHAPRLLGACWRLPTKSQRGAPNSSGSEPFDESGLVAHR